MNIPPLGIVQDAVTLNITSWSDSEIDISGFTGQYGQSGWILNGGDSVAVSVWNAQTGNGPANYSTQIASAQPQTHTCADGSVISQSQQCPSAGSVFIKLDRGNGATYNIGEQYQACFGVSGADPSASVMMVVTDNGTQIFSGQEPVNATGCVSPTVGPPVGPDTVTAVATITGPGGTTTGSASTTYVTGQGQLPVGNASVSCSPQVPNVGEQITCTATTSGAASSYTWDFGDGSPANQRVGSTVTYTYNASGTYTVIATAAGATTSPAGEPVAIAAAADAASGTTAVSVAPGGVWIGPCQGGVTGDLTGKHCPDPAGALVEGHVRLVAKAYPTHSSMDPQIDHVNFTAQINGNWIVACTVATSMQDADGNYSCDWWPGTSSQPLGQVTISFDVYDTAGNVHRAPNGEHTVSFDSSGPSLLLPFDVGQTWDVCQGYNGYPGGQNNPDHVGNQLTALDLVYRPSGSPDPRGSSGCIAEAYDPMTQNVLEITNPVTDEKVELKDMSKDMPVDAPAAGTLVRYWSKPKDIVCMQFDAGGSAAIGHLHFVPSLNLRDHVAAGEQIGIVNAAGTTSNQGGIAHIHIEVFPTSDCSGNPVPFVGADYAQFQCVGDLPLEDLSNTNQYGGPNGVELTRC